MRQLRSGRGRRGGFTLIGVLVVAALLAAAILFVTTIFANDARDVGTAVGGPAAEGAQEELRG